MSPELELDVDEYYSKFLQYLLDASLNMDPKYFKLSVSYQDYEYRERVYCYELYHQIRKIIEDDFPYALCGEVDKRGHEKIEECGAIIPDFLIHNPGFMGPCDNLIIIEVKSIEGIEVGDANRGLIKDINKIKCMINLKNGYHKGIILVYGSGNTVRKQNIRTAFFENTQDIADDIIIIYHENPLEQANIIT